MMKVLNFNYVEGHYLTYHAGFIAKYAKTCGLGHGIQVE